MADRTQIVVGGQARCLGRGLGERRLDDRLRQALAFRPGQVLRQSDARQFRARADGRVELCRKAAKPALDLRQFEFWQIEFGVGLGQFDFRKITRAFVVSLGQATRHRVDGRDLAVRPFCGRFGRTGAIG